MIQKLIYLVLLSSLLACNKAEVDPLFEQTANERATKIVSDYKTRLTSPQYGWKGAYYPNGAQDGGYSFYLKFNENGALSMYSDIALGFTDQAFETSFQLKLLQKPTLIFDTYSYLHELVNPDYNGGPGAEADLELAFESVIDEKIILKGIRNNSFLELTKVNAADYQSLTKGGLATIYKSTIDYVNGDKFLYLNTAAGEKADIFIDFNTKQFQLYFLQNGRVETRSMAFITTVTGLQFKQPIVLFGTTVNELIWDPTLKQYYYQTAGQRVNLAEGNRPAIPFYSGLGVLFSEINFDPKLNTQSAWYKGVYDRIKAQTIALSTAAPVRVIDNVYMYYFSGDNLFAFVSNYTRTYPDRVDTFGATVLYAPSVDSQGRIRFIRQQDTYTLVDGQFSAGASPIVLAGIKELTDALESNTFSWDYDSSESKAATLKSTTKPEIVIKGRLL
jgi:hypothetical protein